MGDACSHGRGEHMSLPQCRCLSPLIGAVCHPNGTYTSFLFTPQPLFPFWRLPRAGPGSYGLSGSLPDALPACSRRATPGCRPNALLGSARGVVTACRRDVSGLSLAFGMIPITSAMFIGCWLHFCRSRTLQMEQLGGYTSAYAAVPYTFAALIPPLNA